MKMYKVWMVIDEEYYCYGTYDYADRNKANEVAMRLRDERNVDTWVEEVVD